MLDYKPRWGAIEQQPPEPVMQSFELVEKNIITGVLFYYYI